MMQGQSLYLENFNIYEQNSHKEVKIRVQNVNCQKKKQKYCMKGLTEQC